MFSGNDDERATTLMGRIAQCQLRTATQEAPRPKVLTRRPVADVEISWLLSTVADGADGALPTVGVPIERDADVCRTPRRNAQIERAVQQWSALQGWATATATFVSGNGNIMGTLGSLPRCKACYASHIGELVIISNILVS